MSVRDIIEEYIPCDEQEEKDKDLTVVDYSPISRKVYYYHGNL